MRKKKQYFKEQPGSPSPLIFDLKRRAGFNEVDAMGIVWYGRYSVYFEEAQAELGRRCGLGYRDFYEASLRAPIVEFHIDYYQPIYLDEEFTVRAALIWSEGAKLYMEYTIIKKDASIATRAYTIQLFIDSNNSEPCLIAPEMLENLRRRWKKGEFKSLR